MNSRYLASALLFNKIYLLRTTAREATLTCQKAQSLPNVGPSPLVPEARCRGRKTTFELSLGEPSTTGERGYVAW